MIRRRAVTGHQREARHPHEHEQAQRACSRGVRPPRSLRQKLFSQPCPRSSKSGSLVEPVSKARQQIGASHETSIRTAAERRTEGLRDTSSCFFDALGQTHFELLILDLDPPVARRLILDDPVRQRVHAPRAGVRELFAIGDA